ncbi:MAG: bifunctional D-glycero-beta-D-manno-heptose-7-phosphate kinase/D-glycero-beta-D-manno-heptose 1-phosphate adenylyltransferase HldE [Ectothiorhodospiraceae bacterium]
MELVVPDFGRGQVLVVGDLMLDRYWTGDTSRVSPEAPVPVVRVNATEDRPGGAGNVALNIAALGGGAGLQGLTGDDPASGDLAGRLEAAGVTCRFQRLTGQPTICKLRVMSRRQQLMRLDFEEPFRGVDDDAFLTAYRHGLEQAQVVVLSDYAKGTLRDVPALIDAARAAGTPVYVDPKGQDFSRYRGADLVTPNSAEFQAVVGECPDAATLGERARAMLAELDLGALLITRGEHGMTLVPRDGETLHLPAHAREVFDVTGAGDTVIAVLAAARAAGADLPVATALANVAAGLVVAKVGTAQVTPAELRHALHGQGQPDRGPVDRATLAALVDDARARGERVVFTNGCFDLLHAGHVAYLQQARALGDRLIVAVNDDASVRRLKGGDRPLMPLDQRMEVLAALAAVDYVVPFSEDTPEELVRAVSPDVLVKGGDYAPEAIAGGDHVRARGGEVVVLDFVDGVSTTGLIQRIRADGAAS